MYLRAYDYAFCRDSYQVLLFADSAKRIFYRAINACPWSKNLWAHSLRSDGIRGVLNVQELSDVVKVPPLLRCPKPVQRGVRDSFPHAAINHTAAGTPI